MNFLTCGVDVTVGILDCEAAWKSNNSFVVYGVHYQEGSFLYISQGKCAPLSVLRSVSQLSRFWSYPEMFVLERKFFTLLFWTKIIQRKDLQLVAGRKQKIHFYPETPQTLSFFPVTLLLSMVEMVLLDACFF